MKTMIVKELMTGDVSPVAMFVIVPDMMEISVRGIWAVAEDVTPLSVHFVTRLY